MFGEIRLATPYLQQMTLHTKNFKIIHFAPKIDRSVNYFGVECELSWSGLSIILIILSAECFFFLK
jgi:hypothetical protein